MLNQNLSADPAEKYYHQIPRRRHEPWNKVLIRPYYMAILSCGPTLLSRENGILRFKRNYPWPRSMSHPGIVVRILRGTYQPGPGCGHGSQSTPHQTEGVFFENYLEGDALLDTSGFNGFLQGSRCFCHWTV